MEVIQGGFQKGMWQSDRDAYSAEDIEEGNGIFEELAQKHNSAWRELIWNIKEPSHPLKCVK